MDVNINIQGSQQNGIPALRYLPQKTPLPPHAPHKHMALVQSKPITCAFDGHTLFFLKGWRSKFLCWVESPPSREPKNLKRERERGRGDGRWRGCKWHYFFTSTFQAPCFHFVSQGYYELVQYCGYTKAYVRRIWSGLQGATHSKLLPFSTPNQQQDVFFFPCSVAQPANICLPEQP